MSERAFWRELKRRHVYRVAAAYAIVGWLLIQVVTQVFPIFHLPDWIDQAIVLLILIGFPIALVLAWAFDATPHGIVRTDVASADTVAVPTRRRSRRAGIAVGLAGVLIAIGAGAAWWHFQKGGTPAAHDARVASMRSAGAPSAVMMPAVDASASRAIHASAIAAQPIPAKSIAVLPFVNESGDRDQQYFSDGLSEDLITALSQFSGLKVISRDSAFQFRHNSDNSKLIGEKLGVAHLLEGSVQRAGDEVRISATLVNAADGSILWSQRYDKPYKDLFALQDAITAAVADALKAKLLTAPGAVVQSDRPPSGNLTAYTDFQQGRFYMNRSSTQEDAHEAIGYFTDAVHADPHYALAYAELASAWGTLAGNYLDPAAAGQAWDKASAAVRKALSLNPDLAAAHSAHAFILSGAHFDWMGAEAEDKRAVQLAPNDATAKLGLAASLATLGHPAQAVALLRQAVTTDPLCAECHVGMAHYLSSLGQFRQASRAIHKAVQLQPGAVWIRLWLVFIDTLRGNATAALQVANAFPPGHWRDLTLAMALQIGPDRAAANAALQTLIARQAGKSAYQIAEVYALRGDPDNMFKWLDRAWENRDAGIAYLLTDPLILRYRNDPRFAAFCKKVGLPTTAEAPALPMPAASAETRDE